MKNHLQLMNNYSPEDQLRLFVRRAVELQETPIVKKRRLKVAFRYRLKNKQVINSKLEQPEEVEFRSFLLLFRQFISNNEPIYLNRIWNLCINHLSEDRARKIFIKVKKQLKTDQKSSNQERLQKWIN